MSHLLRPGERLCPRFGIFFFRDSSVLHEQPHKFDSAPAACPTKRCAFQNVVARTMQCRRQHMRRETWRRDTIRTGPRSAK